MQQGRVPRLGPAVNQIFSVPPEAWLSQEVALCTVVVP